MLQVISPGLYTFTGLIAGRVYLIEDSEGVTIIDASIPPSGNSILNQLRASGRQPSDVKRILITHAHPDHIGALPLLAQATGAQVIVHELELPVEIACFGHGQPITQNAAAQIRAYAAAL